MSQGPYLRKYGVQTTINFQLFEADGVDFRVDAAHATGDTVIMKDEGAEANTSNGFTDEGTGYSIVLTATEMQAARIVVYVVDQTATKVWLDTAIIVETYGNASAMHAFDLDTATQDVNVASTDDIDLSATQKASVNAEVDTALTDYDAVVPADLPTNFADLSITATTGRVDVDSVGGTSQTAGDLMGSLGEENAAAAAGDPSTTESVMQYVKQLVNVLVGSAGIGTYPAAAAPANAVSLAEVIRAIYDDTNSLDGTKIPDTISLANINAEVDTALTDYDAVVPGDLNDPTAATIADAVWDEALAAHNTGGTFGQTMRQLKEGIFIREGTAQAGANGSITLDASASATNDFYNHTLILLTGGTGAGQVRLITDYVGSTKVASVGRNWTTNPDATSEFFIIAFAEVAAKSVLDRVTANTDQIEGSDATDQINAAVDAALDTAIPGSPTADSINERIAALDDLLQSGGSGDAAAIKSKTDSLTFTVANQVDSNMLAISGDTAAADNLEESATAIVFSAVNDASATTTSFVTDLTEATDDHYNGRIIVFTTGALAGQATDITDYTGSSKTVTVTALTEAPADGDEFVIL